MKEKLVLCARFVARLGMMGAFGHLSAIVPDHGRVWLTPGAGMDKTRLQVKDLVCCDLEGRPQTGTPPLEWPIHTEVHKARPEVQCVIHAHSHYATVFSVSAPLLPVLLHAAFMAQGVSVYSEPDLIVTPEQGSRLAGLLGYAPVALLRGHGSVVVGSTIEEAFFVCYFLEENARKQRDAAVLGSITPLQPEEAAVALNRTFNDRTFQTLWRYFAATEPAEPPIIG